MNFVVLANEKEVMMLTLPEDYREFQEYYDDVQEKIYQIPIIC